MADQVMEDPFNGRNILYTLGEAMANKLNAEGAIANFMQSMSKKVSEVNALYFIIGMGAILAYVFSPFLVQMIDWTPLFKSMANVIEEMNRRAEEDRDKKEKKPKLKSDPPAIFQGDPDEVIPFLTACRAYFEYERETDENVQYHHIITNLTKSDNRICKEWARGQLRRMSKQLDTKPGERIKIFEDWTDFKAKFTHTFCVRGLEETAEKKIQHLRQGKESCETFTQEFNSLMDSTNLGDRYYYLR
jgi:Retrotransposon gag protein